MLTIRDEETGDGPGIRALLEAAFSSAVEADLVDALRVTGAEQVSLVAVEGRRVVGHVLFTPVVIERAGGTIAGFGLGPMAVVPDRQRAGIGSTLACEGIARLRRAGSPFVVVLGHPGYYPRFGFEPASRYGVRCPWSQVPDEAFMILVLDPAISSAMAGLARYRPEFDEAT